MALMYDINLVTEGDQHLRSLIGATVIDYYYFEMPIRLVENSRETITNGLLRIEDRDD
jgi:hypothetical protein